MASSSQAPPNSDAAPSGPLVDITYKLVYQCINGGVPRECDDSHDHIRITNDPTSFLNPSITSKTDFIIYRAYFVWAKYSGQISGAYNKAEDTLYSKKLLEETLQKGAGNDKTIAGTNITLFKERTQNGTIVQNGSRYVRVDVKFAGSPALSAKIWGKRVTGDDDVGAVRLSVEEKLRLGIVDKKWRWKAD